MRLLGLRHAEQVGQTETLLTEQLRRDNDLLSRKMALKDILNDLKLKTGKSRSEKK